MATFTVEVRSADVLLVLRNGLKRQAYAIANALNRTGRAIQDSQRARVLQKFMVRKTDFIMRQAAVLKFASAPEKRFEIKVSVGQKARLLLPLFESGAQRIGQRALRAIGETGVAVPVLGGARPSERVVVPEPLWLSRLRLRRRVQGRIEGVAGTFVTRGGAVRQRMGDAVRTLYVIVRGGTKIPRQLGFYDTALREAAKFSGHLEKEIAATFKFHFFGGGR